MRRIFGFVIFVVTTLQMSLFAQTTLLDENFDGGFPAGWLRLENDGQQPNGGLPYNFDQPWIMLEDTAAGDSIIASTSYFQNPVSASRWLVSPQISLLSFGNKLSFQARSFDASFPDSMVVLISESGTDFADFSDTLLVVNHIPEFWESYSVDLSDLGWVDTDVYIAFRLFSIDGYILALDDVLILGEVPANTENYAGEPLQVYPNPAEDMIYLNKSGEVTLYDVQGKIVFWSDFHSDGQHIDLAALQSGVYFLEWQSGALSVRKKILKQ